MGSDGGSIEKVSGYENDKTKRNYSTLAEKFKNEENNLYLGTNLNGIGACP
jgi:hypothetical protein